MTGEFDMRDKNERNFYGLKLYIILHMNLIYENFLLTFT